MKMEQRVALPRQSSLMDRNLWLLHALARAFTAPSFLSQKKSLQVHCCQPEVAPTTGDCSSHFLDFIDYYCHGKFTIVSTTFSWITRPEMGLVKQINKLLHSKFDLTKRNQKNLSSVWPEILQGQREIETNLQEKHIFDKLHFSSDWI